MEYFFTERSSIGGTRIAITGDEFHHLARVMRKRPGDEIFVSAGQGTMYRVVISELLRDSAICSILDAMENYNELPSGVVLVQGILKNPGKMDFIVEKATELGVARIIPVQTTYSVAKGGKAGRWRSIALAAMKQCGRCRLPIVDEIIPLSAAFASLEGLRIVCYEQESLTMTIEQTLPGRGGQGSVSILIGPEGGFSDEELAMFRAEGMGFASLGARRLRSETAAIAALARTAAALEQFATPPD